MEDFLNAEDFAELLGVMEFAQENEEVFDEITNMSRVSAGSVLCTLIESNARQRGEDPVAFAQMLTETIIEGIVLKSELQ